MYKTFFISLLTVISCATQSVAQDIFFLGEIHDNPHHHRIQADWIERINPTAVVFEMLTSDQATAVMRLQDRDLDQIAQVTEWAASGWPDFDIYSPVFAATGDRPVVGAMVPRDVARTAFERGVVDSFGPSAGDFGLARPLPESEQDQREEEQFRAHCGALPRDMLGKMVDIQRLRDATLARAALNALGNYGTPVVVITGNGHARRDWGAPAYVKNADHTVSVFSLGLLENGDTTAIFDETVVTDPVDRPDPCLAFGKSD